MREYCADFETTTEYDDCRVWAWGMAPVGGNLETFEWGCDIDSFMDHVKQHPGRYWFHNLKFDGSFIMHWLLSHDYVPVDGQAQAGQFSPLIDDMGKVYSISWEGKSIVFADSLKKITLSVAQVARAYGLTMTKGDIDYRKPRPVGYVPTPEELDYLQRDVLIMASAMAERLKMGTKVTTSSDCLAIFRDMYGRDFRNYFPCINRIIDAEMRRAYRGGWVYCNPIHQGQDVGRGIRLDVNSLYPWAMDSCLLPYGQPDRFPREPKPTPARPLWIATVTMTAKLRPGKLPCIQVKGSSMFGERDYVDAVPRPHTFTVCSVDWDLWQEMYEVDVWEWHGGYSFQGAHGLFSDYVQAFRAEKENAPNAAVRFQAKLKLNTLYGKTAQKMTACGKLPYLGEDDCIHYKECDESERDPVYLPAGIFIAAWARQKTVRTACEFGDRFCYADTDSIHAIGEDIPDDVEIHPTHFGAWKHEATFERARFVRAKTYVETVDGIDEFTCAGMAQSLKDVMRFEDFRVGFETAPCPYHHPGGCGEDCAKCYSNADNWGLKPKQAPGGCVLVPSPFRIK